MNNRIPGDIMPHLKGQSEHLSVLLPAFKEADNLRLLLPSLRKVADSLATEPQILVIDSATPLDDTLQVCAENKVMGIPRKGGNNYGDAIRTGISVSTGDYVVVMDADGSHNPEFIRVLWEKRRVADVVIASRYVPGGLTDNPWVLVTMSRILNLAFKAIVGLPVCDVSDSFRLYRGDLWRSLRPTCSHFDVLEEILVEIICNHKSSPDRILEVPYHFESRKCGKSKRNLIAFGFRFLAALYRLRKMRNNYDGDQHLAS
jgi:dolichol-phosphate mannosyltransferase